MLRHPDGSPGNTFLPLEKNEMRDEDQFCLVRIDNRVTISNVTRLSMLEANGNCLKYFSQCSIDVI
jgi:hypothetical protein